MDERGSSRGVGIQKNRGESLSHFPPRKHIVFFVCVYVESPNFQILATNSLIMFLNTTEAAAL